MSSDIAAALDRIRAAIPDAARDIRLNVGAVLEGESVLSAAQRWGVALATAEAARNALVRDAVLEAARAAGVEAAVLDDAQAAAALMAMNNVFYRFRHFVEKPGYGERPARLRMQRIARPAASKVDFELMCLAVSAVNGCQSCVQAHERVVVGEGGLGEEHVHEAVRVAAVMAAAAQAVELARVAAESAPHSD